MTDEDLKAQMLDSLIELMNKARLEKDAKMFESYARLAWILIMYGEETC